MGRSELGNTSSRRPLQSPGEEAAFPFGAGNLAARVRVDGIDEPPMAGDLPAGEFLGEEAAQVGDRDGVAGLNRGNDGLTATVGIVDAEDDAIDDGRMVAESGFNCLG